MKKMLTTSLLCFILVQSFSQAQRKPVTYLMGEYNNTLYDRTKGNNPWGMGVGLQLFFNKTSKLKPTIDLTADAYLENDKVLRLNPDNTPVNDVGGMVNVFTGLSYHPVKTGYVSVVAGPSFIHGQTLLGLKPSLGFYFSGSKKCTAKISYINVFRRDKITKQDFRSISLSLGIRLF